MSQETICVPGRRECTVAHSILLMAHLSELPSEPRDYFPPKSSILMVGKVSAIYIVHVWSYPSNHGQDSISPKPMFTIRLGFQIFKTYLRPALSKVFYLFSVCSHVYNFISFKSNRLQFGNNSLVTSRPSI